MAARCRREVGGVPACPHVRGGGRPRSVTEPRFDHCSLHLGSRAEQDVARVPSVAAAAERPWIGRRCIRQNKTLAAAELCHKHLLLRAIHSAGVGGASATLLFLQLAHRQRSEPLSFRKISS